MKITISLGQINVIFSKPKANLEKIAEMVVEASLQGSSLIIFPELWSTGYDLEHCSQLADKIDHGMFIKISKLAAENHIYIGGSLMEKEGNKTYNTFTIVDPRGIRIAFYRKIHLFKLMDENLWLCAGNRLETFSTPWGNVGLAVCYDLRFPEVFRFFATQNASMALICAEWPTSRLDHWRSLLRARAIENQMFIVACNRVGQSPSEDFGGFSSIIGPWGNTNVEADGTSETLLSAEIDMDEVNVVRRKLPVLSDRRSDIYG